LGQQYSPRLYRKSDGRKGAIGRDTDEPAPSRGELWPTGSDPLDTFGSRAVVQVRGLQNLLQFVCKNGFEHHAAMTTAHAAAALHESFTTYFGWDTYWHGGVGLQVAGYRIRVAGFANPQPVTCNFTT